MTSTKTLRSEWLPEEQLLVTQISGQVDEQDVDTWHDSLMQALQQIPEGGKFKIFVNLHGFKAVNLDAHKRFRSIIPLTLARYGWKVGYVDLFPDQLDNFHVTVSAGIHCVGAAHCHEDETKIQLYQKQYSSPTEHFFTDPVKALQWIRQLPVAEEIQG